MKKIEEAIDLLEELESSLLSGKKSPIKKSILLSSAVSLLEDALIMQAVENKSKKKKINLCTFCMEVFEEPSVDNTKQMLCCPNCLSHDNLYVLKKVRGGELVE